MPLPNTRMFHPQFEAHHRPVADGQLTAECVIERPTSAGTYNSAAGRTTYPTPEKVYPVSDGSGPCRVQHLPPQPAEPEVGDRTVTTSTYRVTITTDSDLVQVNDIVRVTACTGDPSLVGRLVVRDVTRGSVTWQRDLMCELYPVTSR